ncbi:hypothetical protein [Nocardioides pantholopis]|uniref:hypothetical protein n=1 Tax=Nocardioides pantholopis TaxID=2483798 RepID=UPI000F08ADD7|nr:hypothetical protein [Nocardioides pantholopis]
MTEPRNPAPTPEPDLTPEQEDRVRDLLADARHDGPVPDDVAARLDQVLARLGDEDREADPALVARRRQRGGRLLAAAACLVVGGVVAGQLVSSDNDSSSDADDQAGGGAATASSTPADSSSEVPLGMVVEPSAAPVPTSADPVEVRPEHFALDAAAISPLSADVAGRGAARSGAAQDAATPAAWFTCEPGPWGDGDLVAVQYEGEPAVLAYRPAEGATRVVEVLRCGTGEVLRSVTVPLP